VPVHRRQDDCLDPPRHIAGVRASPVAGALECQLVMTASGRYLARLDIQRLNCGINAEWLQGTQDLAADSLIDLETAKGNATVCPVIHICALAIVAPRPAIADVHLPSAMPTSEKAREQQLSLSGSTTSCAPFARSIIGDHDLISLKLVPRDVA